MKEYALYEGEEILIIGTIKQIAEKMNLSEKTLRHFNTPSYKKKVERMKNNENAKVLVLIEDEEEEEEL